MNNRSKNNSIIFLTTLSVYLGLVLVGGAMPTVLAQAATTRNFNVQDEIEVKDDLDKKPKDEELKELSGAVENYFRDLGNFIEDLQKLHGIEKFNLDFDTFTFTEETFHPCISNGGFLSETSKKIDNRWLEAAIIDASYQTENWDFLSDCLPHSEYKNVRNAGTNLSSDKADFKYEIFITKDSPQKAEQLAKNFAQAFKLYEPDEEEITAGKLYEKTTFKSENNQVFIVTQLPRGSLDALLKQDAKAEK